MQPILPSEIIDGIVDEIGSDANQASSREALRSLALVSAALRTRAYGYLFQELHLVLFCGDRDLMDPNPMLRCQRTLSRLHDTLIQSLRFPGVGMVYHIHSARFSLTFAKKRDLITLCQLPAFSGLLNALHGSSHGITSLRLEILDVPGGPSGLKGSYPIHLSGKAHPDLYEAFVSLCRSQRLTTLHLKNFAMYSKTLCGTYIENLHLEEFMFEDDDDLNNRMDLAEDSILHPTSLALLNVRHGPLKHPKTPATLLAELANSFHPQYNADESILQPLVFNHLTSLTLNDDDIDTPINLFPQLKSLRVLQHVYWMRRAMGFITKLPRFFIPQQGVIRDLGSTTSLIVETDINFREIFLNDAEDVRLWDAWDIVDSHLTSDLGLQNIQFIFRFRITPGRYLSYQQEPSFVERNRKYLLDRFPLLASNADSLAFSLDILMDREINMTESTVRCKGRGSGWW